MASDNAPPVRSAMPDPRVAKGTGERCALEGPAHRHVNADHNGIAEVLDVLLDGLELGDPDCALMVRVEIILLAVQSAVGPGEDEGVIEQCGECRDVAS